MIIETSDNRLFLVTENKAPELSHVWLGLAVKRIKGGFTLRAKAKPLLVRKAGSQIIDSTPIVLP